MGLARSRYVQQDQEGIYHCFCRCVRRAFLYGYDAVTKQDFSHRKTWIVDRMKFLSAIFAIDVCAFAVLANHYHNILRTRPDLAASWSDREVATRWLQLCPRKPRSKKKQVPPVEDQITALLASPHRIAQLRQRLCSLSWFMGRLNEFIARTANAEDKVKGRFWESRFKCQPLLDDAALLACMAYVDLNPIRAGLAATPEDSDFTSIQERIRAWQQANRPSVSAQPDSAIQSGSNPQVDSWLCPISSGSRRRGLLDMPETQYFDLIDQSGRALRQGKRGSINPELAPILLRMGAKPESWINIVTHFGDIFRLAAGSQSNLRDFADKIGVRWLSGVSTARASFL
jgi:REP element-mobilizing transposase RayT